MDDRRIEAIKSQGQYAAERVAWLRRMVEKQQKSMENFQQTVDVTIAQLEAAESQVDFLREMYREALERKESGSANT